MHADSLFNVAPGPPWRRETLWQLTACHLGSTERSRLVFQLHRFLGNPVWFHHHYDGIVRKVVSDAAIAQEPGVETRFVYGLPIEEPLQVLLHPLQRLSSRHFLAETFQ